MSSKYEMWLTHNNGASKLQFPILPEEISVKNGSLNKSVTISGLGEITIKQDRPALTVSFEGFFPAEYFPGVQVSPIVPPETIKSTITEWKNSDKPVHFILTGTDINMYCTIEEFSTSEQGGDVGTLYYSIELKEYREVSVKQIDINTVAGTATLPAPTPTRTDNSVKPKTHTVVKGDTLWAISKKYLGAGNRYPEIAEINDIIKNPNLIHIGWVLTIPAS